MKYFWTIKEIEERVSQMTFDDLIGGYATDEKTGKRYCTRVPHKSQLRIQTVDQIGPYTRVWLNNGVKLMVENF